MPKSGDATGVARPGGLRRRSSGNAWLLVVAATAVAVTGCGSTVGSTTVDTRSGPPEAGGVAPGATSITTPTVATPTVATPTVATPPPTTTPSFTASVSKVDAAQLGGTWRAGCPVDPDQLRALELRYWGFDDQAHLGTMVVNASVVDPVIEVFSTLYGARFPIEEMVPASAFGGDDNAAAAADDTSGFNCRYAVAPGPPQWSAHAYGEAIDVNDVQNPYVEGTTVIPAAGAAYEDRAEVRPGMAVPGGTLVDAFASVGWQWGGRWTGSPDYQHFSSTGG